MGEKFRNLKSEFKKVIWPDKKRVLRQSLAVVACSIVLGLIIALIDVLTQTVFGLIL